MSRFASPKCSAGISGAVGSDRVRQGRALPALPAVGTEAVLVTATSPTERFYFGWTYGTAFAMYASGRFF